MKVLFISKRSPQQRDLLTRPYGRFHYLPVGLAALGHDIKVVLIDHRGRTPESRQFSGVSWIGMDVRSQGLRAVWKALRLETASFQPDWVVGGSDSWAGCIAQGLAESCGAKLAIDAYDNFEAYMPWNLLLHHVWRAAVARADLLTVAGPQLANLLNRHRDGKRPALTLPMAADPNFVPADRQLAREQLRLPRAAPLIGYFGGWAANRGTELLIRAFRRVRAVHSDAKLVLSGNPPKSARNETGVIVLGYLDDISLPTLTNAVDVSCVVTADTAFGRYSYPAKLCEALACGAPIVATATAPVRWMLQDDPRFLSPVGDDAAYADLLLRNVSLGRIQYPGVNSWSKVAAELDHALASAWDPRFGRIT